MEFLKTNRPKDILGRPVVDVKAADGYKFICDDSSWLMLRLSGTEPILRIYSEASSEKKALAILEEGKRIAFSV
jgi:phosphomannomutase